MLERFDHGYKRYSSNQNPCRCEVCRTAKAAYMREKRKAAGAEKSQVVKGIRHGTAHGYKDNKCKCDPCKQAGTRKRKAERLRAEGRKEVV